MLQQQSIHPRQFCRGRSSDGMTRALATKYTETGRRVMHMLVNYHRYHITLQHVYAPYNTRRMVSLNHEIVIGPRSNQSARGR